MNTDLQKWATSRRPHSVSNNGRPTEEKNPTTWKKTQRIHVKFIDTENERSKNARTLTTLVLPRRTNIANNHRQFPTCILPARHRCGSRHSVPPPQIKFSRTTQETTAPPPYVDSPNPPIVTSTCTSSTKPPPPDQTGNGLALIIR